MENLINQIKISLLNIANLVTLSTILLVLNLNDNCFSQTNCPEITFDFVNESVSYNNFPPSITPYGTINVNTSDISTNFQLNVGPNCSCNSANLTCLKVKNILPNDECFSVRFYPGDWPLDPFGGLTLKDKDCNLTHEFNVNVWDFLDPHTIQNVEGTEFEYVLCLENDQQTPNLNVSFNKEKCQGDSDCNNVLKLDNSNSTQINNHFPNNSLTAKPVEDRVWAHKYSDIYHDGNSTYSLVATGRNPSKLGIYQDGILKASLESPSSEARNIQGSEIEKDGQGNIYISGAFKGSKVVVKGQSGQVLSTVDSGCSVGHVHCTNGFIMKFNSSLNSVLWVLVLDAPVHSAIEDFVLLEGNTFAITGTVAGANFNPHGNETNNSISSDYKAFIAKYDTGSSQPLLEWLRMVQDAAHTAKTIGFGITKDGNNNVFVAGSWQSKDGFASLDIDDENGTRLLTGLTSGAPNKKTRSFVCSFDNAGNPKSLIAVNLNTPSSKDSYLRDIEFYDNKLYGVGLFCDAFIGVGSGSNALELNVISENFRNNNNYYEVAISDKECLEGKIYSIGWDSRDVLINIYKASNFEKVYNLESSGQSGYATGLSISVDGSNIYAGMGSDQKSFKPGAPVTNFTINYGGSGTPPGYFVGKYECQCE
jgi:hypothetical protein